MLAILAKLRDFLIATALAWVGVTVERAEHISHERAPACAESGQSCQN